MEKAKFPKKVRIVEVGPRDGLQNEKKTISTEDKAKFIEMLSNSGHQTVEVTSFVRPDRIPQMGDATKLFPMVANLKGTTFPCLVPNLKGLEQALELGVKEIAVFTASSDTFNQKNINATISQSFERITPVIERALSEGMKVRGYVSTAFGCPYEGKVEAQKVVEVASRLDELGCYEISIGDTIGSGVPSTVSRVLSALLLKLDSKKIALHFHDTRGTALSNVLTGLSYGINVFDSSAGGLGGCPYAKGATGNLATEDLLYFLNSMGIETGVDLDKLVDASVFMLNKLEKQTTSKFLQAYLNGDRKLYLPVEPWKS